MRYLLLVLLFVLGCEPPQTFEDDMSIHRHLRTNRNPPVAEISPHGIPPVVPVIPRDGLWSGYNQLGYQASYGPDQRQNQTILKLDEWGPPEVWTISLYTKQKFTDFNGYNIKARINFGAGGSTQVYECDWINGTQISLPMNAINVVAIFDDVSVTTEGNGLEVGVQLARGSRGGTRPPVLTLFENLTIAGNGDTSDLIELPEFAKRVIVIPTAMSNAEYAVFFSNTTELLTTSGNTIGTINTGEIRGDKAPNGYLELPVIGSARFAKVANLNAGAPPGVSIVCSMYVELDG